MLFPIECAVCGRAGASPCGACILTLRRAPALAVPPGLDRCHALLAYDGPARDLVARLKYRNARGGLRWLADAMAGLLGPAAGSSVIDVVTWAPTSDRRRRHRGFDQAELLARRVASTLDRPCRPLLVRLGGPPQTGRSRSDRWRGPLLAPRCGGRTAAPGTVVVVDDVITTGASLSAAARALKGAGVLTVVGLAAARTPEGQSRRPADGPAA